MSFRRFNQFARRYAWCTILVGALSSCKRPPEPLQPLAASSDSSPSGQSQIAFRSVEIPLLAQAAFSSGSEANLFTILEIVGGGVGCLDYDLSGQVDLFFAGGGQIDAVGRTVRGVASKLYRLHEGIRLSDVSAATHAAVDDLYTHGMTSADFDNDGFLDMLVYGYPGVRLLHNQGDGTFRDETDLAGLGCVNWVTAASWIDLERDGCLDLYLASYVDWSLEKNIVCPGSSGLDDVCSPNAYASVVNKAYRSLGDGVFMPDPDRFLGTYFGKTLGVLAAKFDPRDDVNLYVANDLMANFLLRRQTDHKYEEQGMTAGVALDALGVANGSMGLALLDFNLDQRFDIFVTNLQNELMALYLNEGQTLFRHSSRPAQLNIAQAKVVGFGVVAVDFDCDGDEDVLLTSGDVHYKPDKGSMQQLPLLIENNQGKNFRHCLPACDFFDEPAVGRGLASADLDNDGDLDIVETKLFGAPVILENTRQNDNSWLRIGLVGTESARTPIGTVATLTVDERVMVRQLYGGGSYLSQSEQVLSFGWPENTAAKLSIQWPSGRLTDIQDVAANQRMLLVEPR